jgi:hypothetical protein
MAFHNWIMRTRFLTRTLQATVIVWTALLMSMGSLYADNSTPSVPTPSPQSYLRSARFGINHISGPETITPDERYQKALELGAGWNRWPLYWNRVETDSGVWDWSDYDRLVADDLAHGLGIDAILLGMPDFHRDDQQPVGLQEPIFSDGTDAPRAGKTINANNTWAEFVWQAVTRYRPGGDWARETGQPDGAGIRLWEIWNEPDFSLFWKSSIGDYARLLKTAYIVAKWVDPEAQVMFGGMLFNTNNNWLAWVLAIFEDDPQHEEFNWYMDAVALHSYSYPWRSGWLVNWVDQTLKAYNLKRPIWVNESGVPVWDDYPGPTWAKTPAEHQLRATSQQQADFFIQSTAYALAEGAAVVFYHQLYDDCGNQPGGTDFAPDAGPTCEGGICFGDTFGLYRNPPDAACFRQHPEPDTPRPSAAAYRLATQIFGTGTLRNPLVRTLENRATVITFDRPERGERIYVMWNTTLDAATLNLPMGKGAGALYQMDSHQLSFPDSAGIVALELPPATCDYFPFLQSIDITAIGGTPLILVGPLPAANVKMPEPTLTHAPGSRTRCPK